MTERELFAPYISRRGMLRSGAMLGAGAALAGGPLAGPAFAQPEDWPALGAMLGEYVEGGKVANMALGLGWGQQYPEFLTAGETSFTSGVAVDADTLYRIYSMTKPITGMAAMICVDEGLMGLDQPIAEILPAFAEMQVQKVYDGPITADNLEPATRPITIRNLLTHTSGLGYSIVQTGPLAEAYTDAGLVPGLVSRLQDLPVFRGTAVRSLELFADRLAEMPLVYQPGTKWSYSVGLDLMGRIIEVVSGQAFDAFLKQRIFDPCGMTSTFFRVPESEAHRMTANYFVLNGTLLPIDLPHNSVFYDEPPFAFGGSGLVSTARDYDRFLRMLAGWGELDGARVMSEEAVRLGTSDLFPDSMPEGEAFEFGGRQFGFGAAGLVGKDDAEGLYGWFGAAGTCGLVNLKWGLRHNLMTQYMPATTYPIYEQFALNAAQDAIPQLLGQRG